MRIGSRRCLGCALSGDDERFRAGGDPNTGDSSRTNTERGTARNATRMIRVVAFFR
jgi:hypothetical protein